MRTFNINYKRLGITLVVLGLVIVLFGLQVRFQENINEIALMNNGLKEFKEYRAFKDKFIYKLPEAWNVENGQYEVSDFLYNIEFDSKDRGINGYIQMWNSDDALETFIDRSKKYEVEKYKYDKYASNKIDVNSNEGYEVNYSMICNNKIYNVYEYFIKKSNNIFKIAFSVDENKDRQSNSLVFKNIVNTINYTE